MRRKLYITDLDGTFLNEKAELSEYTKLHINNLIKDGILFSVASARSFKSIKKILSDVELNLPIIEFNGGYITNFETGQHIVTNDIGQEVASNVYETIKKSKLDALISTFNVQDILFYSHSSSEGMSEYIHNRNSDADFRFGRFNEYSELYNYKIMCFTVIDTKEKILHLEKELNRLYKDEIIIEAYEDMYYAPWYWLSIHSKESTKAKAIKTLCELYDLKDVEICVFGDNKNDIEMFKIADKSYAVENAVDEVKELSDEIIGLNTDESVIKKISELEVQSNDVI